MGSGRRSRSLTREEILGKALHIIDTEGLSALSMRKLGAALRVDPMMIYRHVPDKEALLDLTVEHMRSGMVLNDLPDDPAQTLEEIFAEYRRVLQAHPNMLPLATRRTDATRPSGLEYLLDQGLSLDDAVELYQSLAAFTVGFALLGSTLADGRWKGIPEVHAERLRDWRDETFRRTLKTIMRPYGVGTQRSDSDDS
jgi:AcrR family transcriptional regulator